MMFCYLFPFSHLQGRVSLEMRVPFLLTVCFECHFPISWRPWCNLSWQRMNRILISKVTRQPSLDIKFESFVIQKTSGANLSIAVGTLRTNDNFLSILAKRSISITRCSKKYYQNRFPPWIRERSRTYYSVVYTSWKKEKAGQKNPADFRLQTEIYQPESWYSCRGPAGGAFLRGCLHILPAGSVSWGNLQKPESCGSHIPDVKYSGEASV